jgi:hypothetical protein
MLAASATGEGGAKRRAVHSAERVDYVGEGTAVAALRSGVGAA